MRLLRGPPISALIAVFFWALIYGTANGQTPAADPFAPNVSYFTSALAVQSDARVLIGGGFSTIDGVSHSRVARLTAEGAVESGFTASADATVYCLGVQPDGRILVGGDFTYLGSSARRGIGRLNANGSVDTGFVSHLFDPPPYGTSTMRGQAILVQPDGKIIVGGRGSYNGGPVSGFVARLNTNGTTDSTWSASVNGPVTTMALQPDGKVLIGGSFSLVGNYARYRIARLNTNGSPDLSFNARIDSTNNPIVCCIAVQPDEQILVAGAFSSIAGEPRTNIVRLNPDGSIDRSFTAITAGPYDGSVYSMVLQADQEILISGYFTTVNGSPRNRIARLHADGSVDNSFNAGANAEVYGLAVQPDGKVLAAGFLTQLALQNRKYVGRLQTSSPAAQRLEYDGSTISWTRCGSSCEVWRTTFEFSTNAVDWVSLGAGARVTGGWQLSGISIPGNAQIRARGYVAGGGFNGSNWFIQSLWPAATPTITKTTSSYGDNAASFGFRAGGTQGATVVVERSLELRDWALAATNVLFGTNVVFTDPAWTNSAAGFYRLRVW